MANVPGPTLDELRAGYDYLRQCPPDRLLRHVLGREPVRVTNGGPQTWSGDSQYWDNVVTVRDLSVEEIIRAARTAGVTPLPPHLEIVAAALDNLTYQRQRERSYPLASGIPDATQLWNGIDRTYRTLTYDGGFHIRNPITYTPLDQTAILQECDRQKKEADEAKANAVALLKKVVTAEEFLMYETNGWIGLSGKVWAYRIRNHGQTQIRALQCGCLKATACLQIGSAGLAALSPTPMPNEDRVVGEYLLIKNDEQKYLKTANVTWLDKEERSGLMGAVNALAHEQIMNSVLDMMRLPRFDFGA